MKSIYCFALVCAVAPSLACSSKGSDDPASTGSGASTSAGGSAGTATTAGTAGIASGGGGDSGSGGTATTVMPALEFAFAADLENWGILTGMGASSPDEMQQNTSVDWDGAEGQPELGSMKISVPFSDVDQSVAVQVETAEPMDFSGKKLTFKALLESGLSEDPTTPGGVRAFAKGGEWVWAEGTWKNIGVDELGTWVSATLDFSDPAGSEAGYDATMIRQVGIQILTGSMGTTYGPAVLYIDAITVQ